MAHDEPSAQLHLELREAVQAALATHRPILHHLNADTSWLLQLPRPDSAVRNGGRLYYNILIDPWLGGYQIDFASWFSQQWHREPCAVGSIAAVEELAQEIEILASGLRIGAGRKSSKNAELEDGNLETFIDALAISHEFTDHCHQETLLQLHPDVPVFAVKEAVKVIRGWQHFRTITKIDEFGPADDVDWRSTSVPPLPEWVGIGRLVQHSDVGNLHSALMITFNNQHARTRLSHPNGHSHARKRHATIGPDESEESAEAVIYTPHGIAAQELSMVTRASPTIRTLALVHGLQNVRLKPTKGITALQINRGGLNGLEAQRALNARYWVSTHDEIKRGRGLIGWLLQQQTITPKEASSQLQRSAGDRAEAGTNGRGDASDDTHWVSVGNGESKILE
ncbi:hypothetical protein BAUCODRAFT_120217 [Baudoinia panamericana UAMH 10762]|uniref:Uncharacterized protein n=1 Tax=Baudoinia panamericana (strain UAMH 10762) TaxID=717646 RepID=M2NHU1_BAUPA|nr:uncharacterized protein BAUCODRAFT_120217 [Baudoinia panamericana UAMH 10762]EMC98924.1 hypothetical protein BAUCODRAFT_120217 [Baudoinia panamericana UAMH 10762]